MESRNCSGETLAHGPACRVDACPCGTVHVSIGMLTLRLKREAFESFCGTLFEAMTELSERNVPRGQRLS